MEKDKLNYMKIGDAYELRREQWNGRRALISDYPGLLDEVRKYTWTCTCGTHDTHREHPYLRSSKLNISLHKFVLAFLYGAENLDAMLMPDNIIEHLDNDGLNCSYDNLHIISSDNNKAKAFTIDKEQSIESCAFIPNYTTDVYYSHVGKYYQLQIFFIFYFYFQNLDSQDVLIEKFIFQYYELTNLFIDWLYILDCLKKHTLFDVRKFHSNKSFISRRPQLRPTDEELNQPFLLRDGQWYMRLCTDDPKHMATVLKTAYVDLSKPSKGKS